MKKMMAALGSLLLLSAARADDWTQFRGPRRDSVWSEKGLLETFPADGLKVRWRVPTGGGFSSPVIAGGRVWVSDSVVENRKARERVRCLDEKSGAEVWAYGYDVNYDEYWLKPEYRDGPRGTPTLHGGRLYGAGAEGNLFCLDAAQGTVIWKKDLPKEYDLGDHRTMTPSPLIEGDLLIVVMGGKPDACVVAFHKDTGKEVWRALGDRWTYSSPIIVDAGGKRQLIVWTPQAVTSLEPSTGKTYWRELVDLNDGTSIVATPVAEGDLLLVSGMMFQLDREKPAAKLLWPEGGGAAKRVFSTTSMPLILGDYVYTERWSGMLACFEAKTGKLIWKHNQGTTNRSGASLHLVPNGDSVLMFTDLGDLVRARLSPEGYKELSRTHLVDPTFIFGTRKVAWTPPSYANRHIFVRTERELVCASLAATPE